MVVIACVAIIVVGPKDLPKMLRGIGKTVSGLKKMAGDFQRQFDDAIREADLEDVKDLAKSVKVNPLNEVKQTTQEYLDSFKDGVKEAERDINKDAATDKKLPDPVSVAAQKKTIKKPSTKKPAVKKTTKASTKKSPAKRKTPAKSKSA